MALSKSLWNEADESFNSKVCPGCDGPKAPKFAFCRRCYGKLPPSMQRNLYRTFSEGYPEYWDEARAWLKAHPMPAAAPEDRAQGAKNGWWL